MSNEGDITPWFIGDRLQLPTMGLPNIFTTGAIQWTADSGVLALADDSDIKGLLRLFILKHKDPSASLQDRRQAVRELWKKQYNKIALIFVAKFFCTDARGDKFNPRGVAEAINALVTTASALLALHRLKPRPC
jgi:hypothetical protein